MCTRPRPTFSAAFCNKNVPECLLFLPISSPIVGTYLHIACRDELFRAQQQFEATGTSPLVADLHTGDMLFHVSSQNVHPHKIDTNKLR